MVLVMGESDDRRIVSCLSGVSWEVLTESFNNGIIYIHGYKKVWKMPNEGFLHLVSDHSELPDPHVL